MTRTNYSFVKCIWYHVKYGERHFKDQLQTALKYAGNLANTVYESIWLIALFRTWLIVLSCCWTSNTCSCYSTNEPPWANKAAQCHIKRSDARMGFWQWKGRSLAHVSAVCDRRQRSLRPENFLSICTIPHIPAEKVVSPTQPFPDDVETTASDI